MILSCGVLIRNDVSFGLIFSTANASSACEHRPMDSLMQTRPVHIISPEKRCSLKRLGWIDAKSPMHSSSLN